MSETGLVLSYSQIQQIDNEYEKLSEQSHFDDNWETDYQAALMAPAAFLLNKVTNFESAFDRILFHLDEATKKTQDITIQKAISRTADDIFSRTIHLIQNHIDLIKKENDKGFLLKFTERVNSIIQTLSNPSSYFTSGHPGVSAALNIAPEISNMFRDFLFYLNDKFQIEKNENIFYNQLSHVYQKILDSLSYNPEFGLIRNTFTRNKEEIIRHVVYNKGFNAGKQLMKFDKTESEIQDSIRIIVYSLIKTNNWDNIIEFFNDIRLLNLQNYRELESMVIKEFTIKHKNKLLVGIKNILRTKLKEKEQKALDKYVEEYRQKLNGTYDDFNIIKKEKFKKKVIIGLIIVFVLGIFNLVFNLFNQFNNASSIILTFSILSVVFYCMFLFKDNIEKSEIQPFLQKLKDY